jgi:hypothetical protein
MIMFYLLSMVACSCSDRMPVPFKALEREDKEQTRRQSSINHRLYCQPCHQTVVHGGEPIFGTIRRPLTGHGYMTLLLLLLSAVALLVALLIFIKQPTLPSSVSRPSALVKILHEGV